MIEVADPGAKYLGGRSQRISWSFQNDPYVQAHSPIIAAKSPPNQALWRYFLKIKDIVKQTKKHLKVQINFKMELKKKIKQ